jgi:hypothetical protein
MRWKWLLATILILPFAGQVLGQNSDDGTPPPLGDVAKKNKDTSKSKAKWVVTDDDPSVRKNPLPAVALEGADNTQAVLNAIHEFKKTHDAAETERVVHEWFDEQSDVLSAAIDANSRIAQHNQIKMEAAQDGNWYGGAYDGDYTKVRQRQLSEVWAQRSDARSNRDNWQVVMRIQQAFFRVRCDVILNRGKTAYDWFRIRNANGVGTY